MAGPTYRAIGHESSKPDPDTHNMTPGGSDTVMLSVMFRGGALGGTVTHTYDGDAMTVIGGAATSYAGIARHLDVANVNSPYTHSMSGHAYSTYTYDLFFQGGTTYGDTITWKDDNVNTSGSTGWIYYTIDSGSEEWTVVCVGEERGAGSDWSHLSISGSGWTLIDGSNNGERHKIWTKQLTGSENIGLYADHGGGVRIWAAFAGPSAAAPNTVVAEAYLDGSGIQHVNDIGITTQIEAEAYLPKPTVTVIDPRQVQTVSRWGQQVGRVADPSGLTTPVLGITDDVPTWIEAPVSGIEVAEDDLSPDVSSVTRIETTAPIQVTDDTGGQVTLTHSAHAISDMSDVDTDKSKTPADGDVLTFDGTDWNAEVIVTGDTGRLILADGITDPPEPVWTEDGTDFIYEEDLDP